MSCYTHSKRIVLLFGVLGVGLSSASEVCFDEDRVGIADCECHETCATCGFDSDPTGKKDCITCADGDDVKPFYADGTGTCKKKKNKDKKNKGKKSKKKKNKDRKSKKKSKK